MLLLAVGPVGPLFPPHRALLEEHSDPDPMITEGTAALEQSRVGTPLLRFLGRMLNSSARRAFEKRHCLHRHDLRVKESTAQ